MGKVRVGVLQEVICDSIFYPLQGGPLVKCSSSQGYHSYVPTSQASTPRAACGYGVQTNQIIITHKQSELGVNGPNCKDRNYVFLFSTTPERLGSLG